MVVELAVEDFLLCLDDGLGAARFEKAERAVGFGGGALHQRQCRDQRARHALFADREIMPRALGLRAPIGLRRHFDWTEGIGFGAGFHPGIRTNPIVFPDTPQRKSAFTSWTRYCRCAADPGSSQAQRL